MVFVVIASLSNYDDDDDDDDKVRKTIEFMSKTTALLVHHAFSTFLWRPLHDYDVKPRPNGTFCGGREHTATDFPLFIWTWIKHYTWRIELFKTKGLAGITQLQAISNTCLLWIDFCIDLLLLYFHGETVKSLPLHSQLCYWRKITLKFRLNKKDSVDMLRAPLRDTLMVRVKTEQWFSNCGVSLFCFFFCY